MADEDTPDPLQDELDDAAAAVEATLDDEASDAAPAQDDAPDGATDAESEDAADAPAADSDAANTKVPDAPAEDKGPGILARVVAFARAQPRMAAAIAVGAILFLIIVRLTACAPPPADVAFWNETGAYYGALATSANRTGGALNKAATRADARKVRALAERQLRTVENISKKLNDLQVSGEGQVAMRNAMIEAISAQRDFLELLVRATSPGRTSTNVGPLVNAAKDLQERWSVFLKLVPTAPPTLTYAGLPAKVLEFRRALATPAPPTQPTRAARPAAQAPTFARLPGGKAAPARSGVGFRAGGVSCRSLGGNGAICQSSKDVAVRLYSDDAPIPVRRSEASPVSYPATSAWRNQGGGVSCAAAKDGVTCQNLIGQGFRLTEAGGVTLLGA